MGDTIEFTPILVERADWQSHQQVLTTIRKKVFVEEQGVPEAEEIDDLDPRALHWLARDIQGTPIGTARLTDGRIGRMAVLAEYRNQGVGAAILRAIIKHARDRGLERLVLDAQTHALPFYQGFGFTVTGEEFEDVGIPHRPMSLELSRFEPSRQETPLPRVDEDLRRRQELKGPREFAAAALQLVEKADRGVRLFSARLDPELYDDEGFCEAIFRVATRHPGAEVKILVRDTSQLLRQSHRLVELFLRLTSRLELRRLNPERETAHTEFLVCDERGLLRNQSQDGYQGYCCRFAPLEARQLGQDFDALWHGSEPDPAIRRLHI